MGWPEKIRRVPELIKLENSIFVLPFTYIGMLFAGNPTLAEFIFITLALLCARGAAFSINRYVGLPYDAQNPKKRNWSSVKLYTRVDMIILAVVFIAVFMACAYALNMLAFLLAPLIIALIVLEPYTKKYTANRHLTMGLVIGLGILGGYIGAAGTFPATTPLYILLLGYMCFSAGSDVVYSISHRDFDKHHGLKTYATKYGVKKSLGISTYLHLWASALFTEFGLSIGSPPVMAAGLVTLPIFYLEHKKASNLDEKSIRVSFFYYNALVSLLMLAAFSAFFLKI